MRRALRPMPDVIMAVGLGEPGATIGVEGVVDGELPGHVLEIIAADLAEAAGHRVEPPGLFGDVARVGVGTAYDRCQRLERRIRELVDAKERVEGALRAVVTELRARHVERDSALAARGLSDFILRNEEKLAARIDKALDQPRAGDAIHSGLASGYPLHGLATSSSSRSSRARIACRAAGRPSLTAGISFHCSTGTPGTATPLRSQPKATTRQAPATSSRLTRLGFSPPRSTPSCSSARRTGGAISGSGSVPAEAVRIERPRSAARRPQSAAASTLLAAPCRQTKRTVRSMISSLSVGI